MLWLRGPVFWFIVCHEKKKIFFSIFQYSPLFEIFWCGKNSLCDGRKLQSDTVSYRFLGLTLMVTTLVILNHDCVILWVNAWILSWSLGRDLRKIGISKLNKERIWWGLIFWKLCAGNSDAGWVRRLTCSASNWRWLVDLCWTGPWLVLGPIWAWIYWTCVWAKAWPFLGPSLA